MNRLVLTGIPLCRKTGGGGFLGKDETADIYINNRLHFADGVVFFCKTECQLMRREFYRGQHIKWKIVLDKLARLDYHKNTLMENIS